MSNCAQQAWHSSGSKVCWGQCVKSYLKTQANAAMGGKLYSGGYTKGNFVGVTGRGDAARAWGRHGVGMGDAGGGGGGGGDVGSGEAGGGGEGEGRGGGSRCSPRRASRSWC